MRPISTIEKPSFREMLQTIAAFKISFPGRKGMIKEIGQKFDQIIFEMKVILEKQKFVSTSVDILSNNCYIDDDLNIQTLVLCFQQIKRKHTFDVIARAISKIHERFGLQTSKVTHTVTDGGSNFVETFKSFANQYSDTESSSGFKGFEAFLDSDNESECEEEIDFNKYEIEPVNIDYEP